MRRSADMNHLQGQQKSSLEDYLDNYSNQQLERLKAVHKDQLKAIVEVKPKQNRFSFLGINSSEKKKQDKSYSITQEKQLPQIQQQQHLNTQQQLHNSQYEAKIILIRGVHPAQNIQVNVHHSNVFNSKGSPRNQGSFRKRSKCGSVKKINLNSCTRDESLFQDNSLLQSIRDQRQSSFKKTQKQQFFNEEVINFEKYTEKQQQFNSSQRQERPQMTKKLTIGANDPKKVGRQSKIASFLKKQTVPERIMNNLKNFEQVSSHHKSDLNTNYYKQLTNKKNINEESKISDLNISQKQNSIFDSGQSLNGNFDEQQFISSNVSPSNLKPKRTFKKNSVATERISNIQDSMNVSINFCSSINYQRSDTQSKKVEISLKDNIERLSSKRYSKHSNDEEIAEEPQNISSSSADSFKESLVESTQHDYGYQENTIYYNKMPSPSIIINPPLDDELLISLGNESSIGIAFTGRSQNEDYKENYEQPQNRRQHQIGSPEAKKSKQFQKAVFFSKNSYSLGDKISQTLIPPFNQPRSSQRSPRNSTDRDSARRRKNQKSNNGGNGGGGGGNTSDHSNRESKRNSEFHIHLQEQQILDEEQVYNKVQSQRKQSELLQLVNGILSPQSMPRTKRRSQTPQILPGLTLPKQPQVIHIPNPPVQQVLRNNTILEVNEENEDKISNSEVGSIYQRGDSGQSNIIPDLQLETPKSNKSKQIITTKKTKNLIELIRFENKSMLENNNSIYMNKADSIITNSNSSSLPHFSQFNRVSSVKSTFSKLAKFQEEQNQRKSSSKMIFPKNKQYSLNQTPTKASLSTIHLSNFRMNYQQDYQDDSSIGRDHINQTEEKDESIINNQNSSQQSLLILEQLPNFAQEKSQQRKQNLISKIKNLNRDQLEDLPNVVNYVKVQSLKKNFAPTKINTLTSQQIQDSNQEAYSDAERIRNNLSYYTDSEEDGFGEEEENDMSSFRQDEEDEQSCSLGLQQNSTLRDNTSSSPSPETYKTVGSSLTPVNGKIIKEETKFFSKHSADLNNLKIGKQSSDQSKPQTNDLQTQPNFESKSSQFQSLTIENEKMNPGSPNGLLIPENLAKLQIEIPQQKRNKSIYTNKSIISRRKDGKKQINQYVLMKVIGQGNFAKVYECENQEDKKTYAMKCVNKKKLKKFTFGGNKAAYNFLESEMAILKKLDHPNVLQLYEIIDDSTQHKLYLITELVTHGNLDERIKKKPELTEDQIRSYFRDLISALEYCHECAQIIHRDIKPENILIDNTGHVKLADFGVSFMMKDGDDSLTTNAGTQLYQCPEASKKSSYSGKKSDIWAAGVTLYYTVLKDHPFSGQDQMDLFQKICNEEPIYPARMNPLLVDLLKKIFIKDPNERIDIQQIKMHPWVTKNGEEPMQIFGEEELQKKKVTITDKDKKAVFTRLRFIARVMAGANKHHLNQESSQNKNTSIPTIIDKRRKSKTINMDQLKFIQKHI